MRKGEGTGEIKGSKKSKPEEGGRKEGPRNSLVRALIRRLGKRGRGETMIVLSKWNQYPGILT